MTDSTARRRGHGEDAIYFDAAKNRYVGAVSLGFGPDGKRSRRSRLADDFDHPGGHADLAVLDPNLICLASLDA